MRAASSASTWVILGASCLTTLGALPPFLVGAQAVPLMRDLGFGPVELGFVVSTFFAVAAIATFSALRVLERVNGRVVTALAGALVAMGSVVMVYLATSWTGLIVAMVLLGAANAACHGAANRAIATELPVHRRGLGFGIKQSAVPVAIMLSGLAVPTMTAWWGWRSPFLLVGATGVAVLVGSLTAGWLGRRRDSATQPAPPVPPAPSASTPVTAAPTPAAPPPRPAGPSHPVERAPTGPLVICVVSFVLASAAANSLGSYFVSWAYEANVPLGTAGIVVAISSALSTVVRIGLGHRADLRFGRNLPVVAFTLAVGAIALTLIGAVAQPWAVIAFGMVGYAVGWSWPGLFLYAVARLGRDAPTHASSMLQAGAFLGGALGPLSFGLLVDAAGFPVAWQTAAAAMAIAAVLTLVARRGFERDLHRRPPSYEFGYGGGRHAPRRTAGPG